MRVFTITVATGTSRVTYNTRSTSSMAAYMVALESCADLPCGITVKLA